MLGEAQRALPKNPDLALAFVRDHERRYPDGLLGQEREAVAVSALWQIGRRDEARQRAERFAEEHPRSTYLGACDAHSRATQRRGPRLIKMTRSPHLLSEAEDEVEDEVENERPSQTSAFLAEPQSVAAAVHRASPVWDCSPSSAAREASMSARPRPATSIRDNRTAEPRAARPGPAAAPDTPAAASGAPLVSAGAGAPAARSNSGTGGKAVTVRAARRSRRRPGC